jgi:AcrR family transcriptional regulator
MTVFQRARSDEQRAARRRAILAAAAAMLAEMPVAEVSLNELSRRAGLAKSNVLRYFGSREAIFLEVLEQVWSEWLDRLEVRYAELADPGTGPAAGDDSARLAAEVELARVTAATLIADPLLCELLTAMGGVLERNVPLESARAFKARAFSNMQRAAGLVLTRLPHVGAPGAARFVAAAGALLAGLWPHAHPTDEIAAVLAERGYPPPYQAFTDMFTELLTDTLTGISRRARTA